MDFATPTLEPSAETKADMIPNGHPVPVVPVPVPILMTPHDQRRRAALLADSPELSTRPPLNAGRPFLQKKKNKSVSRHRIVSLRFRIGISNNAVSFIQL